MGGAKSVAWVAADWSGNRRFGRVAVSPITSRTVFSSHPSSLATSVFCHPASQSSNIRRLRASLSRPTPYRFVLRVSRDHPDPNIMFGMERTERRPRRFWRDTTRGGDSWGWDIFPDNPRREIGGWLITSEIEQETIRAVVLAYAEGKIELPRPVMAKGGMSSLRNAPSFTLAKERFNDLKSLPKPYNAESIAEAEGWCERRWQQAAVGTIVHSDARF